MYYVRLDNNCVCVNFVFVTDKDDVILISNADNRAKPSFAQRFRERLVYPFQKRRFYAQWENAPMDIRFRLTNKCNENCARCFECSGPDKPLNIVPVDDISFYVNRSGRILQAFI